MCLSKYAGLRKILINSKGCVTIVSDYNFNQDTLFAPAHHECLSEGSFSNESLWAPGTCQAKTVKTEQQIVQVRHLMSANYVYCPGRMIKLANKEQSCPPYVFQMTLNQSFEVAEYSYQSDGAHISLEWKFRQNLNFHINLHFQNGIKDALSHVHTNELRNKVSQIKFKESENIFQSQAFGIGTGSIVVCLIIISVIIRIIKIKSLSKSPNCHIEIEASASMLRDTPTSNMDATPNSATNEETNFISAPAHQAARRAI